MCPSDLHPTPQSVFEQKEPFVLGNNISLHWRLLFNVSAIITRRDWTGVTWVDAYHNVLTDRPQFRRYTPKYYPMALTIWLVVKLCRL